MTWPVDDILTADLDAQTDTPPRAMFLRMAQRMKTMIAGRGAANGVCDLDAAGRVPAARLGGANVAGAPVRLDSGSKVPAAQLPQASESAAGAVELASAAEVNALARLDRAIAPGRLPHATTLQHGITATATEAEIRSATPYNEFVSPAYMKRAIAFTSYGLVNFSYIFGTLQTVDNLGVLEGKVAPLVDPYFVCTSAEHGYAVGDRLRIAPSLVHENLSGQDNVYGYEILFNSGHTRMMVRWSNRGVRAFAKQPVSGQEGVTLSAGRWNFSVGVWV